MVEKITISPSEVRGYGDIVSPKTTEDFTNYRSALTESSGLYTLSYETKGVTLTVDSASIQYGESVVLTATAIDEGLPDVGATVTFYQGETELGTETTGDDGKAEYTVTGLSVGSYSFTAEYDIYTSNTVNVTVNKLVSTITLVSDKSVVATGETYTLSGVLSVGSGVSVKLYNGQTLVDTLTTGTGGAFTKTITATGTGITNTYHAVFEGTSIYDSVTSSNVSVDILSNVIMELGVTGSSFSSYSSSPFVYTGSVYVDWGDNTGLVKYTGGKLTHTYASSSDYDVTIYGNITSIGATCFWQCTGLTSITIPNSVTSLGNSCFEQCTGLTNITISSSVTSLGEVGLYECTGLTSVTIPESVTAIGTLCFGMCTGLTELVLLWDSASEIVSYGATWLLNSSAFDHFLIPEGTTSLYTAKSYPSNLLKEEGAGPVPASIDLTGTKSILSYADSESSVLTATVLDSSDNPVEGATVELYKAGVLWDTLTTDSSGECTKTYTSAGIGDVSFEAKCNLLTKTYEVSDYQYYAGNMQKIKDTFINDTSVSGRTIYESRFTFNSDVELEFKLKNIPNNWLVGFGSNGTTWNSKGVWFKIQNYNQNKASIMYADTGGTVRDVGITTSYDTSTVFTLKSENLNKIYWQLDTVTKAYRDTSTSLPLGLRVDIFDNQDYDIDYIKVKAL